LFHFIAGRLRRRDGRRITYALDDDHVLAIVRAAIDHAAERRQPT